MKQGLILLTLLVGVWAALSGHYSTEPLILAFGTISVSGVWFLVRRMARRGRRPIYPVPGFGIFFRQLRYLPYIGWQVVVANLTVARYVLSGRGLDPRVLKVRASQKTALGRTIYANSITLTPGTVTLDVRGDELLVHALSPATASSVISGEMDREVSRLESAGYPSGSHTESSGHGGGKV